MPSIPLLLGTRRLTAEWRADHGFSLSASLPAGLHLLTLQCDLARFDWEALWMPLDLFKNTGQRTGPWDFDLYRKNEPLIPTWKVTLNGRYLGLFYLQRPTVEDLAERTLRGQLGFYLPAATTIELSAEPLNRFTLDPIALRLEPNPFDRLEPQPWAERGLAANWAAAQARQWPAIAAHLTRVGLDQDLDLAIAGALAHVDAAPSPTWAGMRVELVPLLCWAWTLRRHERALQALRHFTTVHLNQPAWGNPNPLGYSHNGDLGAAYTCRALALIYNWLGDDLGDLRAPVLARLTRQMDIFLDQTLLMQQYWGGAVQQDHGYRSTLIISSAALYLLGHCPAAPHWLSFHIPRLRRVLAAFPNDGFIPFAQYHSVQLGCTDLAELRPALRHASGQDLYDWAPGHTQVPRFVLASLDETHMMQFFAGNRADRAPWLAGLAHFLALAEDRRCPQSAYLAHLLLRHYRQLGWRLGSPMQGYDSLPWAFLAYRPELPSAERPPLALLQGFFDGGAVYYRAAETGLTVAVSCFPNGSCQHALGGDLTGTDLGLANPSCGHFSLSLGRTPLLQGGEAGYRTGTHLGNVLLIDGHGQYGDVGYTMGVPMTRWQGQRLQTCQTLDPAGRTGRARLNLAPAYPAALGLLEYTRDFEFTPERVIIRDTVTTRQPRRFSYQFQTWDSHALTVLAPPPPGAVAGWQVRDGATALQVAVQAADPWDLSVAPTEIVWGYVNGQDGHGFQHVAVHCRVPVSALVIEFHCQPLAAT